MDIRQFINSKQISTLRKILKEPLYLGTILTVFIVLVGSMWYSSKTQELRKINEEKQLTLEQIRQQEKRIALLREEVQTINTRVRKNSLSLENLTANERKMSQVLEKMSYSAAGRSVEVVSFRPETFKEEEKDTLLTVKVKIKTQFNELERYLSRLLSFPQPVKIDWIKIQTLETEIPFIEAELLVLTRIKKDG